MACLRMFVRLTFLASLTFSKCTGSCGSASVVGHVLLILSFEFQARGLTAGRSALPPTPSRLWDRDSKSSVIATRTLSDSDAFTRSLASSSISDKSADDSTEGE